MARFAVFRFSNHQTSMRIRLPVQISPRGAHFVWNNIQVKK